jgi:hypothetical protein
LKILPILVLGTAAAALAVIAFRAPAQDYVAPTPADVEAHRAAPQALEGPVPAECTVLTFEVSGMCCTGCTGKLYDHLRATPGFVRGAVNFVEGLARVVMSKDADPQAFASALRFDKYAATLRP